MKVKRHLLSAVVAAVIGMTGHVEAESLVIENPGFEDEWMPNGNYFIGAPKAWESTGGLGLDIKVVKDRLEINTDIFEFGRRIWPRVRIRAGFEIIRRFWLLAGVDDIINGGRDYFLGLQLRFDDEDLKPLIPLGAVAL